MPIEGLPQRMRELGRLRMGEKVPGKNGKLRPAKLTTWRFTSQSAEMLGVIAELYGGEVEDWPEAPGEGRFYQVRTEADSVPVLIPVGHSLSQWYEFWTADGCTRRCTGKVNVIDDTPCVCPSEIADRMAAAAGVKPTACKPTTRLNVMLPDVPDLGYWRLEVHGYQAAIELPGVLTQYVGLARMAAGPGVNLDDLIVQAELAIEERATKKPGQPRSDYVVPVIRTPQITPAALMSGRSGPLAAQLATVRSIEQSAPQAIGASPPGVDTGTGEVIAAQAREVDDDAGRPFDESNEKLVLVADRRGFFRAVRDAGFDASILAAIVHRGTRGRTDSLDAVLKDEWDRVNATFDALLDGKLAETIIDDVVRLAVVPETAAAS